ncbi:serine hydrolase FSH [Artemisia annua]|uniref:Serine hydrolase FSH n=1 Tax=Artemisia annua TaxID=35608 RepID=A0A2U1KFL2_ARTAN|nr:serine hydrolase FSH [Artemisia annua]
MIEKVNKSRALINWRMITFLLLLLQNSVMVRPGDGVGDDRKGSSSLNYISMVPDKETTGIQKLENDIRSPKKPRFLCLHGHGSSAAIFRTYFDKWPESVTSKIDLVFINGPFPIGYPTPDDEHFEWFTLDKVNTEHDNFEEGISYIENRMIELGPFDGVLGFSQGAIVTGSLPGMQEQGVCLKKVGKIEHVVIISGAKLGGKLFPLPKLAEAAYTSPIDIPSLHIFGKNDVARLNAPELVEAYVDPLVIYHHGGHEVPKLDEQGLEIMFEFLRRIKATL